MTTETVRQAAAQPDLNHREPEAAALIHETRQRLLDVYPGIGSWTPYLLGGSGTAAVEAMATSCICCGPVLVVANGYYSARIVDILAVHHIPHDVFELSWTQSWTDETLDRLDRRLSSYRFEAVLLTHHETTLGRLNPIGLIAAIAKANGTRVLVDAMSSFGADPIDFTNLDAIAASANKCLHGLPGVSFVLAGPVMRRVMRDVPRRSYYLRLPLYEGEDPPLTPPLPALRAMLQALRENPDGQLRRWRGYADKVALIRESLSSWGFSTTVEESSITLVCPHLPAGWSFDAWYKANHERGFALYGCKGDLREDFFQVSTMGETTLSEIRDWLRVAWDLAGPVIH